VLPPFAGAVLSPEEGDQQRQICRQSATGDRSNDACTSTETPRNRREDLQNSQFALADLIATSRVQLYRYELGRSNSPAMVLYELSRALDTEFAYFTVDFDDG
jgi:hypothetical protein